MTNLEELIKDLCPDGVEHVSLGSYCKILKGKQLNKEILLEEGDYPAYNGGTSYSGFTNKYNVEANTIIISQGGASAGFVQFVKTRFWANAHCYYLQPDYKFLSNRFVFHFVKSMQNKLMEYQHGAGIPALKSNEIYKLQIPLPPLPIQEEIVRILDTFTELTTEPTTELTTELTLRKQQYEYYREKLLTFGDEVEWKALGEVACIYDGTHQTPNYTETGVPFVSVQNIKNLYATEKKISVHDFEKYKYKPQKDDLFMTRIGDIGTCAIVENNEPLAYYVTLTLIRVDFKYILPKYLKFVIESKVGKKELQKRTLINAIPIKINLGEINKIKIPMPSLKKQQHIVDILDSFDTLVNDIKKGLPAEIELLQKQYEYYRDKLLTFKKLEKIN